jgi:hypothetical protein
LRRRPSFPRSRRRWLLSATLRRERNCEGSTSRSRMAPIAPRRDQECPVNVDSGGSCRAPKNQAAPVVRKFPQEPAGNQDSERCTWFDKYPGMAAINFKDLPKDRQLAMPPGYCRATKRGPDARDGETRHRAAFATEPSQAFTASAQRRRRDKFPKPGVRGSSPLRDAILQIIHG